MFHFIDPEMYEDSPRDALVAASNALCAVTTLLGRNHEGELDDDSLNGLCTILRAIETVINDASEVVGRMVAEPFAAGYRKGMLFADDYYLRGVADGTRKARDELLANIEQSHPTAAAEYRRRMAASPLAYDTPQNETSGEDSDDDAAADPRVEPAPDAKRPPADAAGEEEGARKRRNSGADD